MNLHLNDVNMEILEAVLVNQPASADEILSYLETKNSKIRSLGSVFGIMLSLKDMRLIRSTTRPNNKTPIRYEITGAGDLALQLWRWLES